MVPIIEVSNKAYSGQQDLQAMIDLIKERPREQVSDFPGILDLQEMLAVPKTQAATRLWTDPDGKLACFAFLERDQTSASLVLEIAASWMDTGLADTVIEWAVAVIRQTLPAQAGTFLLETSTRSDNRVRITLLERLGFEPQAVGTVHMERSLADPIERPQLADGYLIRPIRGEAEAEAWVRLHCLALKTEVMTTEYKLAMMRTPYYDPEMDLVAEAPDGALAAYCVCFIPVEENAMSGQKKGYTDPIATHPHHLRRGLAKALILTGLSLLKEHGLETACLGTSSDNLAMLRTAESVGFRISKTVLRYGKPIQIG
jgi:mycothiol synthase